MLFVTCIPLFFNCIFLIGPVGFMLERGSVLMCFQDFFQDLELLLVIIVVVAW